MIFFVPTSIVAIIVSIKEKLIDWNLGIYIASFGIIGAIIGANISTKVDVVILKKFFAIFLLGIAGFEIYSLIKQYIKSKKTDNKNKV